MSRDIFENGDFILKIVNILQERNTKLKVTKDDCIGLEFISCRFICKPKIFFIVWKPAHLSRISYEILSYK